MELQIGQTICGFTVTAVRPVPDSESQLVQMIYKKTGTELVWVRNCEPNKLFAIAFQTIPQDDTGVFHILEHSVLCGSEKFPVKEPFVELRKSSMSTFLNAMTFPDKTMYPVSSRNGQDFLNLVHVYLDAVFAPKILTDPNIFLQEGWHYEISDDGLLSCNGVVLNEMKGATSSVDGIALRGIMRLLFPDNGYGFHSGGIPEEIVTLTYDNFVDTYRHCYHPSNARVYLDGDLPLEQTLALLEEYLSRYDAASAASLPLQTPVRQEQTIFYEAPADGTPRGQLMLGKILGTYADKTRMLARDVLCDVLAGSNEAPLKKALLETGLCRDVTFGVADGLMQPFMVLRLHDMNPDDADALQQAIRACARTLLETGLSKERLTASINRLAFRIRQVEEPAGLHRCLYTMRSWQYGGDPMLYLHFGDSITALRNMVENGEFTDILEELLLNEEGLCRLHVVPDPEYGTQLRQAEQDRLESIRLSLSLQTMTELSQINKESACRQQTPDTPEALATIPRLDLSQIQAEPLLYATVRDKQNHTTLLRHKAAANGIVYLNVYFHLADVPREDLSRLALLPSLLGELPAAGMDAATVQNKVKSRLGELSFALEVFFHKNRRDLCTPTLAVHCAVLKENLAHAKTLIHQIMTATDFRQPEAIRKLLLQAESDHQRSFIASGHSAAYTISQSHFGSAAAAREAIRGLSYLQWLHQMSADFDAAFEDYAALLEETMARVICQSRMTVSITEDGCSDLSDFLSAFPEGIATENTATYTSALPKKTGIRIPAQISFASAGYHLAQADSCYRGSARLVGNILSLSHLWNAVRVQGGAYGAGIIMGRSGSLFTYSYRDPSPGRTIKIYGQMGRYLKDFCQRKEDIQGYILRTIAETEPLESPSEMAATADLYYFTGYEAEDLRAERQSILRATPETLCQWCSALDRMETEAAVCVVGHSDALEACADEELTIFDI